MGFLKQDAPVVDYPQWSKGTRAERIVPMARHWAEVGFGTPVVLHLFYVVKILLYVLGAWLIALSTDGIGGFSNIASWYHEPIVYQKVVFFTMLFEVVGLGCGFGPLNNRFFPPMGSILYWLRPATIRLPPWPGRVPLTGGDSRTPFDVLLYGALLVMLLVALFSDGTGPIPELGSAVGVLPVWQTATVLGLLALAGLRDKVIFLAARGEVYGALAVCFLFSGADIILAAKLVCLVIWMGAATSKLNKHFPFVISTMMSNNPVIRPRWIKRKFFEHFPDDLRPGRASRWLAHFSTAIEMLVPLVLFFSHGGWVTTIAAVVMLCFHFGILSAIPMGVPLEWNVFMMFSVLALFVGHAGIGLSDLHSPWPIVLFAVVAGTVVLGNLFPRKVSFLPGMRYYAGNWDTTLWCVKPSADKKIAQGIVAIASMPAAQMEKFYGSPETAEMYQYMGYAFRAFNTHGRAMFTLAHRAMAGPGQIPGSAEVDEADYVLTDGERICSTAIGWNFGDGHMHNEQLITALHMRCHFEPGEVRVLLLDAQPIHRQRQQYRLVDAATGEFERGYILVADMVTRQPWDDTVPVHVTWRRDEGLTLT
ncbi:membrane protein [Mycolicibacterium cyprinidarum]|uniref:Membrane protein n=1 Tax=Mycolicibacterium cyprinidarum TaxID=2860311 RepID=A0ABQ4VA47_9MYCO|nr:membrane protein [Mycolicibacterium sp. NGTWSNA01]GJF16994.1 membrane protein [Mycolicibacterium sp. NGTWS0302]